MSNSWQMGGLGRVGEFSAKHCIQHFTCVTWFHFYNSPLKTKRPKRKFNKDRSKTYPRMVWLQNPRSYQCVICLSKRLLNFPLESMSEAQNRLYLISHLLILKQVQNGYFSPKSSKLDLKKWALPTSLLKKFCFKNWCVPTFWVISLLRFDSLQILSFSTDAFWIVFHLDTCGVLSPPALGWDSLEITLASESTSYVTLVN